MAGKIRPWPVLPGRASPLPAKPGSRATRAVAVCASCLESRDLEHRDQEPAEAGDNRGRTMLNRRHFLLTSAAAAAAAASRPAFAQAPVLRLGYQLPLTGQHAQYGQDFKNAAEIQLARFHAANKPFKVEIVYEDSRSDAKEGVAIARKFVDDKAILGVARRFHLDGGDGLGPGLRAVRHAAALPDLLAPRLHQDLQVAVPQHPPPRRRKAPITPSGCWPAASRRSTVICEQSDWGQTVVSNYVDSLKGKGGSVVFHRILQSRHPGLPADHHQDRPREAPTPCTPASSTRTPRSS